MTGTRESARAHKAAAAFAQAVVHLQGEGVPKDAVAAATCFRQAAMLGHATAQFNLGLMYARGLGVERDPGEAAR